MSKDKKDLIFFFISKVITGLLGLFIVTIYSKVLSTEDYGNYSLISGLSNVLISIFIGWIGSSVLRYYIDYKDNKKEFFANIWIYTLVMIIAIILIELIVGIFSNKIPILLYLIPTIYFTISYSLAEVFEKALRASEKTAIYAGSMILQSIFSIIIFIFLVKVYKDGTSNILISTATAKMIFSIISIVCLGFFVSLKNFKLNKEILNKFLKFGIPMIGVWGISWLLNYSDRYIIAMYFSSSEVGIYDMSYRLAENSINILITSFTLAVYPILIRVWKTDGKEKVEIIIKKITNYYFLIVIPAVVGLSCIVNKLYLGILDPQYISGRFVIIIVSIGMLFNGLTAIINKIWQLTEKTKMIFRVMVISVIINILLNIIVIPSFGITGAALTTLFSYMFSLIVTYIYVRKEIYIYVNYKSLMKIALSTILMAIFILLFNSIVNNLFMLLVEILLSVIVYFVSNILLKNINFNEFKIGGKKD